MTILSKAQREQRREAGRALASQVSRDYYRFIGRRGGRAYMFKYFSHLAQTWQPSKEEIAASKSPAHLARHIREMRTYYQEIADSYRFDRGTKMMLDLFRPENDLPRPRRKRKKI